MSTKIIVGQGEEFKSLRASLSLLYRLECYYTAVSSVTPKGCEAPCLCTEICGRSALRPAEG